MAGTELSRAVVEPTACCRPWELDLSDLNPGIEPHLPVLKAEVADWLRPCLSGCVVDATVGAGGHAEALLEASSEISLIGFDRDPEAVRLAGERLARFGGRAKVRRANFRDLSAELAKEGVSVVSALCFDLGMSTMQIRDESRGFSFASSGPLDMRMGPDSLLSAAALIDGNGERELGDIIRKLGEERHYKRIARAIAKARREGTLNSAADLASLVAAVCPGSRGWKTHAATRTFQALRIAVNDELGALEEVLPQALGMLRPGGRIAVISFHSLEDRIVKNFFRMESRDCICPADFPVCRCGHRKQLGILTKKPVIAETVEVRENPASRSAKLRVAERVQ